MVQEIDPEEGLPKTSSENLDEDMELRNIEEEEKDVVDEFSESPRNRRKLLLNGSMSII